MKIKIFIDFDGTLFDTEKLKDELNQAMIDCGLSRSTVEQEYQEWKEAHSHPDPEAMLQEIIAKYPDIDFSGAAERTRQIIENCGKYLFPDAVRFLEGIDRNRFEPILFTLGFEHWQSEKVQLSKIEAYFADIIYPIGDKASRLSELVKPDELFYVLDDSTDFTETVKELYPQARVIAIDRYFVPKEGGTTDKVVKLEDIKEFEATEGESLGLS